YSYQSNKDIKEEVKSNYVINNDSIIEFELSNYDTTKILIIDPLVWATYYGGSLEDEFSSICTDEHDNIYMTGFSQSVNFPAQQLNGAYCQATNISGNKDIILVKFNMQGQRLWSTYYGGSSWDCGNSICADSHDNIYITGITNSNNFPIQFLTTAYWQGIYSEVDAYILKFNSQGQRLWATYYGGNGWDEALSICLDSQDNLYITGITVNSYLPTQQLAGAFWQAANADGDEDIFILKFNSQGQRLWATYYGGSDWDYGCSICTDYQDNIYITGYTYSSNFPTQELSGAYWQSTNSGDHDIFILKFNSQGVRQWATYYGGANIDCAYSICSDSYNNIYVTGRTNSTDFPIQQLSGAYNQCSLAGNGFPYFNDLFILKFNIQGQRLWAAYYGGNYDEMAKSIVADNHNNVYITGSTESSNFATQYLTGAYNQLTNIGLYEAFMLKFNSQGVRQWATYYTSYYGADIVVDHQNAVYFIGRASDYPYIFTVDYGNAAYFDNSSNGSDDAFILKFIFCNVQMPTTSISNRNHFCPNDNGSITLTASGGEGDILKWYTGSCGQTFIGNGVSLTIPSPQQTTTYFARWESCDTSFSNCISVTVNVDTSLTKEPEVALCNRNNFCANDTGRITLTAKGGRGNTLKWYTGKCGETYIGSDTLTILSPAINTTYYARWESLCDTSACKSVKIEVKPLPIVSLGSDDYICEGDSIVLNENSGFLSYLWQDGSTNPNFVVSQPGLYWLRVNEDGCYNADTILYTLCEPPLNIWVPTAFTPNGDGRNDVFKIETINTIKDFHLYIFNRWGQLVFETKYVLEGWDGNSMGKEAASGIYIWKITYCWEGDYKEYRKGENQGKLMLLR
ncbi:MAG: SBBP repeat-containing protein, partial [Bacteroidales bacterium]